MKPGEHGRRLVRLIHFSLRVACALGDFLLVPSHRRSPATRALWLQRHCRRALDALGVDVIEHGPPPDGALIVCNHVGYLDIFVLASRVPVVFVAKREVASWPIWGWLARSAGTIFIDRRRRGDVAQVGREIAAHLDSGCRIAFFPEGTSTDGSVVLRFKSALLAPVAGSGRPVVPAAIAYAVSPPFCTRTDIAWWGDMTLIPHLWQLLAIPSVEAHLGWAPTCAATADRKHLAHQLHRIVAARLATLPRVPAVETREASASIAPATPALVDVASEPRR